MMMASGRMAPSVFSVSTRDSPLETLDACAVIETASAPRPLGRDLEAGAGARGGLEEQVHHHPPLQQIESSEALAGWRLKIARPVQNGLHLFARQVFNPQQALHRSGL